MKILLLVLLVSLTNAQESSNKTEEKSVEITPVEEKNVEEKLAQVPEQKTSDWIQDWVDPGSVCKLK